MTQPQLEIQAIAVLMAVACALPGTFLVLRRLAMLSDAVSHAVLPGLVVGFLLTGSISSPLLFIGAAAAGLLTTWLVEATRRTGLVREDAAIGLVFPALFSIGVLLIARYAGSVHLDADAVLLGELAFAPFDRIVAFGLDFGPRALWVGGALVVVNGLFVAVLRKELTVTTFDAALAAGLGFAPGVLYYALMTVVSVTSVGAFDAVGSVLVVAFFAGPPATALLLARRVRSVLFVAIGVAAACALGGYWVARVLDASIAGAMASVVGLAFGAACAFAPERGYFARRRLGEQQRSMFAARTLAVHLAQHEHGPDADRESRRSHLVDHVGWTEAHAERTIRRAEAYGWLRADGDRLHLTEAGRGVGEE